MKASLQSGNLAHSVPFPFLFLLLLCACYGAGRNPYEIHLQLVTADGLKPGDPVILNAQSVGKVERVGPVMNQAEAVIRFENEYKPSTQARFFLERTEDGGRAIKIVDEEASSKSPTSIKLASGQKIPARVPVETLEDRLWVTK